MQTVYEQYTQLIPIVNSKFLWYNIRQKRSTHTKEPFMYIGNVEIHSKLYLAPMAGVTDLAFRQICRELGAGMSCTELVRCGHNTIRIGS